MPDGVRTTQVRPSFQKSLARVHLEAFNAMREFFDDAKAVGYRWNARNVWVNLRPRPAWDIKARHKPVRSHARCLKRRAAPTQLADLHVLTFVDDGEASSDLEQVLSLGHNDDDEAAAAESEGKGEARGWYSRFGAGMNQACAHLGPECIIVSKHATGLFFARKGKALQAALKRAPLPGLDGSTEANVFLEFSLDGTPRQGGDAAARALARTAFGVDGTDKHCA